jgi:hypothetical protein
MRHPVGWVEPGHTLEFDDHTLVLRGALTVRRWVMKLSISVLVFSLSVVSLIGLNGCNRQDPPPKLGKELPQVPDTAVGGMARGVINKAKGVETTLGEVGNRTAETSKEGLP